METAFIPGPESGLAPEYLFVYGTLRKGVAAPMYSMLARHCEFFADGFINGRLYEVNGYPGLVLSGSGDDIVRGELYRILNPETVLPVLDDYEECSEAYPEPREYCRRQLRVASDEGSEISAWVYVFNHDVSGLTEILNGDYLEYLQSDSGSARKI